MIEEEFLSLGLVSEMYIKAINPTAYFQADFRLVNRVKEYSRRIYSVLDLFGDLGGFAEAMVILGSVFVTSIASRMFLASLIRDIYHVRVDTNKTDIDLLRSKLSGNSKRF